MVKTNMNSSGGRVSSASNSSKRSGGSGNVGKVNYNTNYNSSSGSRNNSTPSYKKNETVNLTASTNVNAAAEEMRRKRLEYEAQFRSNLNKAKEESEKLSVRVDNLEKYASMLNSPSGKPVEVKLTGVNNAYDINVTNVNGSVILKGSRYVRVFTDGSYKLYVDGEYKTFDFLEDNRISQFGTINDIKKIEKNGDSIDIYFEDGSITHVVEGANNFVYGQSSDGSLTFGYYRNGNGDLENIDIYGEYTKINGQFGGNQSDLEKYTGELLSDPAIWNELEAKFPGTTWGEKASYLRNISHSACGFTGSINGLFEHYKGREQEFKQQFGFDMYKINNDGKIDFNYENMIVGFYDYYLTKKGGNNIYNAINNAEGFYPECTQEFSNYLSENYGVNSQAENFINEEDRNNGGEITPIYSKDEILNVYRDYAAQGKDSIMIGSWGYRLIDYDTGGVSYTSRDGDGHAMSVLGEENGNLIVTSWGKKYVLDLDQMGCYNDAFSYFYTVEYGDGV